MAVASSMRNSILRNIHNDTAASNAVVRLKARQDEVDAILWLMTCAALVEADERLRALAACPDDMKETFARVLSAR
jgi:hypothetical protein